MWTELSTHLPLLMALLSGLVRDKEDCKPVLSLIASMLLKKRNKALASMQAVLSVLLYSNGCSKQVCSTNNLKGQF